VRGYSVRGYSVRGYSLMELVVVLAILAVAVAVVAPAVGRTADDVRVRAELAGLAAFLRTAREQAVTRQQALEVTLDPEARVLLLRRPGREGEARVQASRAVSPLLRVEADPAMPRLTFVPHGMSSGARFTIEAPGPRAYVITVDPLTGRVTTQRAAL
jgi:general secretion pathway protein H